MRPFECIELWLWLVLRIKLELEGPSASVNSHGFDQPLIKYWKMDTKNEKQDGCARHFCRSQKYLVVHLGQCSFYALSESVFIFSLSCLEVETFELKVVNTDQYISSINSLYLVTYWISFRPPSENHYWLTHDTY